MAALLFASFNQIMKASTSNFRCQHCGPPVTGTNLRKEGGIPVSTKEEAEQQPKIKSEHILPARVRNSNVSSSLLKNSLRSEPCIASRSLEKTIPRNVPFCAKRIEGQANRIDLAQSSVPETLSAVLSSYCKFENLTSAAEKSDKTRTRSTGVSYDHTADKVLTHEVGNRSDMSIRVHRLGPDQAIITNMFTPEDRSDEEKDRSLSEEEWALPDGRNSLPSTKYPRTAPTTWTPVEESALVPLHERPSSKGSCYSDSGVSAMYTSTPIKNSGDADEGYNLSRASRHNLISNSHEYRPGLSVSQASALTITPASLYDDSLAQVLETGDEEFRRKYSSWVSQLFQLQLTKMHRRLCHHFSRKIDELHREKEQELLNVNQRNREKLSVLEREVEKFRKEMELISSENKRLKKTKDAIQEELRKSTETCHKTFQAELERQTNNVQAECERQKLLMQQKHGDQLKIFLDKSCSQIEKVENEYRSQVDSLNRRIRDLEARNDSLEEQMQLTKHVSDSSGPNQLRAPLKSGSYCFRREKEHLLSIIQDLRNKLYDSEKEKLAMMASHEEDISALNALIRSNEKEYSQKMDASQRNFECLRQTKELEIQKLKDHIAQQHQECQQVIDSLRQKYGSKIETLTEMVQRLQLGMTKGQETER